MTNTRVKDLMAMIEAESDPDQLEILKFDLAQALGRKDVGVTPRPGKKNGVRTRSGGGSEMTDKQKKSAASPETRGNYGGDEVLAANRSKGGRKAIQGTKFSGLF